MNKPNQEKRGAMKDSISLIDQKIMTLKQKKEKLQTQQGVVFLKEAQKICGVEFSMELALAALSHCWRDASNTQKEEWKKSSHTFRRSPQKAKAATPPSATAAS